MMLRASRDEMDEDPVLETAVVARLSALAGAAPSEVATAAGRQRLMAALAAAGPAIESGGRGRRIGITSVAAIGALGAVSAVGAATGNGEMKAPITAIQAVAERAGLTDNGQPEPAEDAARPAGNTVDNAGTGGPRDQDAPAAVERERPVWLPLGNGGWNLPGPARPESVPTPAPGAGGGQELQPSDGPGKSQSSRSPEPGVPGATGQGNEGHGTGQGQPGNASPGNSGEQGNGNQDRKPVATGPGTATPQPARPGLGSNPATKPAKPGQGSTGGRGQGGSNR